MRKRNIQTRGIWDSCDLGGKLHNSNGEAALLLGRSQSDSICLAPMSILRDVRVRGGRYKVASTTRKRCDPTAFDTIIASVLF